MPRTIYRVSYSSQRDGEGGVVYHANKKKAKKDFKEKSKRYKDNNCICVTMKEINLWGEFDNEKLNKNKKSKNLTI